MALSVVFAEGIVVNEPDYDLSSRFVELALMLWWMSIKDTDKGCALSLCVSLMYLSLCVSLVSLSLYVSLMSLSLYSLNLC